MADTKEKMLALRTFDGKTFQVEESVAREWQPIYHMIDDGCADNIIPVPNVSSKILAMIIDFCRMHVKARAAADNAVDEVTYRKMKTSADELKDFEADFVKVEQATLFDLILAANFLEIKELLDLTCQTVADMIKGKTPEEIRTAFNIKNDFTPDEEEEVKRQNQWAFE